VGLRSHSYKYWVSSRPTWLFCTFRPVCIAWRILLWWVPGVLKWNCTGLVMVTTYPPTGIACCCMSAGLPSTSSYRAGLRVGIIICDIWRRLSPTNISTAHAWGLRLAHKKIQISLAFRYNNPETPLGQRQKPRSADPTCYLWYYFLIFLVEKALSCSPSGAATAVPAKKTNFGETGESWKIFHCYVDPWRYISMWKPRQICRIVSGERIEGSITIHQHDQHVSRILVSRTAHSPSRYVWVEQSWWIENYAYHGVKNSRATARVNLYISITNVVVLCETQRLASRSILGLHISWLRVS
jgi:hypothetical protein